VQKLARQAACLSGLNGFEKRKRGEERKLSVDFRGWGGSFIFCEFAI